MAIYPSDHLIDGDYEFQDTIKNSEKLIKQKSCLVTIGVRPTYPAVGYGYIYYEQ